jgi:hypothetical protein
MKALTTALFCTLIAVTTIVAQDAPQFPQPTKEHQWLEQFLGEWDSESECSVGPGQPPMKCKGAMKARMLGGHWLISDVTADMGGVEMTAVQTIGYDPQKKVYVGTWVDSMTNHMWKYEGSVDVTGKILTLEAEGPSFSEPGKMAKYRDAYEFKSKDHIVATSSIQGDDGKWVTFMTGQVRRTAK